MSRINKSVLLNSSSANDVRYSGGYIRINGLNTVKQTNVIGISQINYRAEVQQVVTVGATAYTPTGNTVYKVLIGDVNRRNQGQQEALRPFFFKTPAVITDLGATAALQREAIHLALISKINAASGIYVTAATLGTGTGFTITDDAGYYPVYSQSMPSRAGSSTVKVVSDDTGAGFSPTNIALTTAAVYSVGVGADLALSAPIMDFITGNIISGEADAPRVYPNGAFATAGQRYNMFNICYLQEVELPMAMQRKGYEMRSNIVFVDNGTGTSTTNLAGYLAFERAMRKIAYIGFGQDPNAVIEMFDQNYLIQGALGGAPSTAAGSGNKILTPYGSLILNNIGTQTIVGPTQGANGWLIEQDTTATEGAAYTPDLSTINSQQFVVGTSVATMIAKVSFTTPANIVFMAGFRSKEAHQAAFGSYQNLAAVGTGPAGTALYTYGTLGGAANVATTSSTNALTGVVVELRVYVNTDGVVSAYINNVKYPVYSAGTTPLVFTAGTVLVPFFQYTNLNSAAAVPNITEFAAVSSSLLVQ